MGLSIHFSGTLISPNLVTALSAEVLDICNSLAWKYETIHTEHIGGIVFSPPGCEPVFLSFTAEGRTLSPLQIDMEETYVKAGLDASLIYWQSVKTQYAGIAVHKALLALLRYISSTYFKEFELKDEGLYWETNDEEVLKTQFEKYELALQVVTDALDGLYEQPGESATDLVTRIEDVLKKLNDKKQ